RLVVYSANLTTTSTTDPLFLGGQDVMSRAQFFAIQTRDEGTYGLRTAILTTADALKPTGNPTPLVNLTNSGKARSLSTSATVLRLPEGLAYDLWDSSASPIFNNFLGPSTDWLLLLGNFGAAAPEDPGNGWNVQLTDSVLPATVSPSFPVNTYDDGYHLSATGTILYGLGLGWARLGGPQQFAANYPGGGVNPSWVINNNNVVATKSGKGSGTYSFVSNDGLTDRRLVPGLQFSAYSVDMKQYNLTVTGYVQDERGFKYQGTNPIKPTVQVTFQADVFLGKYDCGGGQIHLTAWIGLYDRTTNQWVDQSYKSWSFNVPNYQKNTNVQYGTGPVTLPVSVSLVPGHTYGWIIGASSDSDVGNYYGSALDAQNMRSILYLKGVALRFP
ncbi:MAG: hypothetical protein NTV33_03110, partial [Coprothermobacterota bacterium]|nr:hypothetical protein [Coprothermobacterota bacterium]